MRTILTHAMRPGCMRDKLDNLDEVVDEDVAALCLATVDQELTQLEQLRAWECLHNRGFSLLRFSDRADATHYLTRPGSRLVCILKL